LNIELDLRTLSLTVVFFSAFFGLGMIIYGKLHKSSVGIKLIGVGHLFIGIGYVLLGMRNAINDFTSIVIANSVIYIGVILVYRGLFLFLDISLKLEQYLSFFLTILLAGILYYYTFLVPDVNTRIIFFSLFFSVICFIPAFGLSQYKKEDGRAAVKLLIIMYCTIGLFYLYRVIWTFFENPLHDFMKAGVIHSLAVIACYFLVIIVSFATVWIATDKLQINLTKMARTDPLTELYNRRTFEEYCDVEFSRAVRNKSTFSIIISDLDHFKKINDKYGHQVGDKVLKIFSGILRNNLRKQDVAARYGGEEFVILLPETDSAKGIIVAENLRRKVQSATIRADDDSHFSFLASFGVSNYIRDDDGWEVVLKRADKSLYSAKSRGRNRVTAL